jgi:phospholipid/cholesterol/gamma-HCH transport system substrate-binding protein
MKISNEVKVGILAVAAIVILILGFNFLKGQSVFNKPFVLYARFPEIGALEKSNQVKINGLNVGTVHNFVPADKEVSSIIVELHIDKSIAIPRNSAALIDGSILGSAYINIEKANGGVYLQSGDTISTRLDQSLLGNIQAQVAPTLTRLNETFDSLKLVIGGLNSIFDPNTKSNVRDLITNLAITSDELARLLNIESGAMAQTLKNLNSVTANLARNNDVINSSLRNVEVTTSRLANSNIEGVVSAMRSTIGELQTTISRFNTNNGTLGLMMNDRQLYDKLSGVSSRLDKVALSAEILFDDIRLHPKRYVNISVFGGKNTAEPITSPAPKDTIPR